MHYKLTREERETQFLTNEASDSWDFWTSSERWARKVERLGYPIKPDHQGGWSCRIPLRKITVRNAHTSKRRVSERFWLHSPEGEMDRNPLIQIRETQVKIRGQWSDKGVNKQGPKTPAAEPS